MILDVAGTPTPPTEVVERLKRIDPHMGLRFIDYHISEENGKWWALTWEWPSTDPRQQMIQEGTMAPNDAYDILGHIPLDCSVDNAAGYIESNLRRRRGSHDEVDRLLSRLSEYNRQAKKAITEPILESAEEQVKANATTLFAKQGKRIPKVFMSGGRPKK